MMFTFITLICVLLMMVLVTVAVLAIGGSAFIIAFGDIIVFILIIVWLIKKLVNKKGK